VRAPTRNAVIDQNGSSALAHLTARVDELQAALDHVTRELAAVWRPRLLAIERDLDTLLDLLASRQGAKNAVSPEGSDGGPLGDRPS
jgi:hypothetical protein